MDVQKDCQNSAPKKFTLTSRKRLLDFSLGHQNSVEKQNYQPE